MYILQLTTDFDYAVFHNGTLHTEDIRLLVRDHAELEEIYQGICGPWGTVDESAKRWCDAGEAIREIIDGKLDEFSLEGGNREVVWYPLPVAAIGAYESKVNTLGDLLRQLEPSDIEPFMTALQRAAGFTDVRSSDDQPYDAVGLFVDLEDTFHGDRIDAVINVVRVILSNK